MHSSAYGHPTCHGSTKSLSNLWPQVIFFFSNFLLSAKIRILSVLFRAQCFQGRSDS